MYPIDSSGGVFANPHMSIPDVLEEYNIHELFTYDVDTSIEEILDDPTIVSKIQGILRERKLKRILK